jgi:hypothetical protein
MLAAARQLRDLLQRKILPEFLARKDRQNEAILEERNNRICPVQLGGISISLGDKRSATSIRSST